MKEWEVEVPPDQLDRFARKLHAQSCVGSAWRAPYPCLNCPPLDVVEKALGYLDMDADVLAVAYFLHDRTCVASYACRIRTEHVELYLPRAEALVRIHNREEHVR